MLVNKQGTPRGEIVNFGSGQQWSNFVVAELFRRVVGHDAPITIEHKMVKAYESNVWICDTSYSKAVHKFTCHYDLESGIQKFLELAEY